jgi:multidrug efflux pump subunit AcrA (membrane-fusion protein)
MAQDAGDMTAQRFQAELEAAQEAAFEHTRLTGRLDAAQSAFAAAQDDLAQAAEALAGEVADVEKLEDFSPTLIWATMRGNLDERLAAERAEHRAAEYRVAAAQAAVRNAERERAVVSAALDRLGDVDARRASALAAKEAWVVAARADGAGELTRLATEVGTTRGELTEVHEVIGAAERASTALSGAWHHLDSAGNWATFDTFGGGGFLADMMKRQKMDQAVELMRTADESLRVLARELGDLGREGVGGIDADGLLGTFDVWFDDIFSDWTVMNRISEARDRVREALGAVGRVHQGAVERAAELETRLAQLADRRETLLTGA